jgi:3-methyladenine DNA glycosylase AlkD
MDRLALIQERIRALGSESGAQLVRRFFKTGPGDYGEGDRFLGVSVPQLRALLPEAGALSEPETVELLRSDWHEERLFALFLLVRRFEGAPEGGEVRERLVTLYLENLAAVNNWDLVDSSAPQILGTWLLGRDRAVLDALATSAVLWERRIAVVSTLAFIREGDAEWTFRLVGRLLMDPHDLMHKACGWMLREAYKKEALPVLDFIEKHGERMPRTMLRYALERLPEAERKRLLQRYRFSNRR